ncbi:uncharacterized protein [Phaseolus vulgaris]|uniref:uncharacterized protein n=1 Tax=Phaseolus vulgaris TaxID=3885 RepID=UPI0035CAE795
MTDLPIRKVLQKSNVAGRMVRWAVELSEFDVQYEPRGPIKGQQGSGVGVILEGPNGLLIEQALRFAFKANNNQAEYEALIVGMLLAKEMGARSLLAKSDSLLVTGQVTEEYQAKDPQMVAYLGYIQILKGSFAVFELVHVPREQNARADLLAKLASVHQASAAREGARSHRSMARETLRMPSVSAYPVLEGESMQICTVEEGDTWMTHYRRYLADGILPLESAEAKKIKRNSAKYTLVDGELFRHGFTHLILVCMSGDRCTRIMAELHEGICGSHVGGRSLVSKVVRAEIQESSSRFQSFVAEESNKERKVNLDLLDEVREEARIKAEDLKRRVEHKHSSKLRPR